MDDGHKFALIHIYKNASISMRNVLEIRGKYHRYEDAKSDNPVTICIIRNPLDRVVSAFFYLFRLEENGLPEQHPIKVTKETNFFNEPDKIKSFDLFLDYIEENGFYDAVTLPQVDFLADRGLIIDDIDEILIQEDMEWYYNRFKSKYGLPDVEFPLDNTEDSPEKNAVLKHAETQIDRIKSLYSEDFNMYNRAISLSLIK